MNEYDESLFLPHVHVYKSGRRSSSFSRKGVQRSISRPQSPISAISLPNGSSSQVIREEESSCLRSSPSSLRKKEEKSSKYTNQQKWVLVCVSLVSFTSYLLMAVLAPFFPHEASKKGMTESVSGGVFSVYALVIMISSPLFGKLIPVTGPKILLVVGVFVSGSSNILFGFLDRLDGTASFTAACFIVRSLEGFGAAAFSTASYTYIMHSFPDDVSAAFGLTETFIGIGETIGPAVGSGLYSLGGYGLPFYVLGALVLLTVPLCYFKMQKIDPYRAPAPKTATNGSTHDTYRQTSNEKTKLITKSSKTVKIEANAQVVVRHKSSYKNLLKIPEVIIVCIVVVIVSQSQGFLEPTVEPHLRMSHDFQAYHVGLVFLLMAVAYAITSPATGWIAGKVNNKFPLMILGLLMSSLGLVLLGPSNFLHIQNTQVLSIVSMLIMGISYALAFIPTFESLLCFAVSHGFPEDDVRTFSLISGLWSAMFSLGEVTGPLLGGLLVDAFGFPAASTLMALFSLIATIIAFIAWIWGPTKISPTETPSREPSSFNYSSVMSEEIRQHDQNQHRSHFETTCDDLRSPLVSNNHMKNSYGITIIFNNSHLDRSKSSPTQGSNPLSTSV